MSKLALLITDDSPAPPDAAAVALWSGREAAPGQISLPKLLEEKLLRIRGEHMLWAYETGFLKAGDKTLEEELRAGESPSMWWTSLLYERHPRLSPWLYDLYKLRALEMLIDAGGHKELVACGRDPALAEILARLCAASGIKFAQAQGGKKIPSRRGLKEKVYFAIPAPIRAAGRLLLWLWTVKRRLPRAKAAGQGKSQGAPRPAVIATYFPNLDLRAAARGVFRSRYWESLHEALDKEARRESPGGRGFVRWLLIRFPSPELSLGQCLALRDRFRETGRDGESFDYLEEFLGGKDILRAAGRWARLTLQSLRLQKKFASACRLPGSRLNFWPLAREQWAESFRGWRCLERCLQNLAFKNYAAQAGSQRWWLFPLENCPWERMLIQAVREASPSDPVYGVQHSIIRKTDFRYFDAPQTFENPACASFQPDVIGGNGEDAVRQLLQNGAPPQRIREMEALRYLYLRREQAGDKAPALPPEPGEPLQDRTRPRLLVLTGFFRDETEAHLKLLGEALDSGALREWEVLVKPHPYYPVSLWLDGRSSADRKKIGVLAEPLSEALAPGVNVWASNSTTAALEAALKNLPLLVMAPSGDFDLCPIQDMPDLPRSSSLEDVLKWLRHPTGPAAPQNYLDLNPDLAAWRKLLGLA